MDIVNFFHIYSEVISGICNIFTSIGTVGAVIVALVLSHKERNPKPKLKVSISNIFIYGGYDYLAIYVDNQGNVPAYIQRINIVTANKKLAAFPPIKYSIPELVDTRKGMRYLPLKLTRDDGTASFYVKVEDLPERFLEEEIRAVVVSDTVDFYYSDTCLIKAK